MGREEENGEGKEGERKEQEEKEKGGAEKGRGSRNCPQMRSDRRPCFSCYFTLTS